MELIKGIIVDWVISSVWSSQVITALQPYTSLMHYCFSLLPLWRYLPLKNTSYLLLLLMLMVYFYWFKQKLVRLVWCLLFEAWACNGIAQYCCWSISSSCPSPFQQKISPNPQHTSDYHQVSKKTKRVLNILVNRSFFLW